MRNRKELLEVGEELFLPSYDDLARAVVEAIETNSLDYLKTLLPIKEEYCFLILGYGGTPIGSTGGTGVLDVHAEEPDATFLRVTEEQKSEFHEDD